MGRAQGYYTTRGISCTRILTAPVCKALCEHQRDHPSSPETLRNWLLKEHMVDVGLTEISRALERSPQYLPATVKVKDEAEEFESEADEEDGDGEGSASVTLSESRDMEDDQNDVGSTSVTLSESEDMEEDQNDDGPASVILSDPAVLDCPICLDLLTIPVYQCENGHVACSSCCCVIEGKCPSCSLLMSHSRCEFIEKVLETASISCTNRKYGCKHVSKYGITCKHEHDKICQFSPCECPEPSCDFMSSSSKLYSHFSSCHGFSAENFSLDQYNLVTLLIGQTYLVLGAKGKNIFILSNYSSETNGSAIKVIQIAPPNSSVRFSYDIKARYEEEFITLHSSVESISKWCADPHLGKKFLQVPHYYASNRQLHLELRILAPGHKKSAAILHQEV